MCLHLDVPDVMLLMPVMIAAAAAAASAAAAAAAAAAVWLSCVYVIVAPIVCQCCSECSRRGLFSLFC